MKSPHAVRPASPSSAVVLSRDRGLGSKEMELVQTVGVLWGEVKKRDAALNGATEEVAALRKENKRLRRITAKQQRTTYGGKCYLKVDWNGLLSMGLSGRGKRNSFLSEEKNCHSRLMHEGESVVRCEVCKDKWMDDQQRARLIEAEDTIASLKLTVGYLEREKALQCPGKLAAYLRSMLVERGEKISKDPWKFVGLIMKYLGGRKLHSELEEYHRLKMVSDESCGFAVRREAGVPREVIDELLERLDSACDKIKDTSYVEKRHDDGDEARWDRILRGVGVSPIRSRRGHYDTDTDSDSD
ncbi:hypothetical protein FOZ63_004182 [Perkinsus olseni]|uniref:Uncharacterized protein n=1 Tax=Perkinsus olseni TaxID=32597 RepID=A0A7J6NG45_PEROL|nr:hypothetical protein FOZ62_008904 [Perkinsus olseni]KAF4756171.1 hypothetical protein FOZ63_004182 [Perkinsus olseni]